VGADVTDGPGPTHPAEKTDATRRSMDRRTFLKRAAQVAAGSAAVGLAGGVLVPKVVERLRRPWDAEAFPPPGRPAVAVVRAASYDGDLEGVVLDGLREIGADVAGRSVLLKPNLVEYDPETVINTDPRLVAATAVAMRRLGAASVVVGEGPGHRRDTQYVVTASGLTAALEAVDTRFVDLNTAELVRVPLHSSFTSLGALWLPAPVVRADVVVSMPKLKTHHWAGATLSLKNCFGCVPGRLYGWPKNALHWAGLDEAIVDVAAAVAPSIQIVDGIVGMEGNGPIQGTPISVGVLVFGTDPVATDATGARLMGLDPSRISYLTEAARFLGQGALERIRQVGEDPEREAASFQVLPPFEGLKVGSTLDPAGAGGANPAAGPV
jgi:uncharacterized protein (DUF362 family)